MARRGRRCDLDTWVRAYFFDDQLREPFPFFDHVRFMFLPYAVDQHDDFTRVVRVDDTCPDREMVLTSEPGPSRNAAVSTGWELNRDIRGHCDHPHGRTYQRIISRVQIETRRFGSTPTRHGRIGREFGEAYTVISVRHC